MTPPPYDAPGTSLLFRGLFGLFAAGELVVRVRSRVNRSGIRSERWSVLVVVATVFAGLAGGLVLARHQVAAIASGRRPLFALGLLLMAAGTAFRHWAILTLGRFFTVDVRVHADQTVVARGPYRWLRHPSYLGLVTFFVGLGLALSSWASVVWLAVLPTTGLVIRIVSEERALLEGLGEPYRRFASTRRRLLPGVW